MFPDRYTTWRLTRTLMRCQEWTRPGNVRRISVSRILSGRRNTASRSQRESNPISLPPASTTQSRFTPATVNVRAAVRTPTVALIAAAGVVITSPAVIPDDFRQRPRVARLASGSAASSTFTFARRLADRDFPGTVRLQRNGGLATYMVVGGGNPAPHHNPFFAPSARAESPGRRLLGKRNLWQPR